MSGYLGIRLGMPAIPRKWRGKNVTFTPMKNTQK